MNTRPTLDVGAASLPEVRAMAIWLAAHGTPVFPLAVGGKTPATRAGFRDASTDPDQITTWWRSRPHNIGISTGPARLCVIDLDTPKADDDKHLPAEWASLPGVIDGADVLAVLAERAGRPMPLDTRTITTPSGGMHLYFHAPHPLPSTAGKLGPMIDTRAVGGYVVAPPSRTRAGSYVTIHPGPIAPLPDWLTVALTLENLSPAPSPTTRRAAIPRGPVHDRYVYAAFEEELDTLLIARPGTRNHALNRAAFALGQFVAAGRLNEHQVTEALSIAAAQIGLSDTEAARTITSGLASGAAHPRPAHPSIVAARHA